MTQPILGDAMPKVNERARSGASQPGASGLRTVGHTDPTHGTVRGVEWCAVARARPDLWVTRPFELFEWG